MWTRLFNRLRYLVGRQRIDRDLAQEIEFHRQMLIDDEERRGRAHAAAALNARRRLGNTTLMTEYARDPWVVAWLDTLGRDLRYGLRSFRRNPAFTLTAMATLALGIGANAAIFTIVNSVLLRPLPYASANRLVMVWAVNKGRHASRPAALFEGDAVDLAAESHTLDRFEAFQANLVPVTLRAGDLGVSARAIAVTPGTFSLLGRQALMGRTLEDGDRRAVVLSYGYWQRQFGGDPQIVGRTVTVGTTPVTVLGIMPADFAFPYTSMLLASVSFTRATEADMWVPMTLTPGRPAGALRLIGGIGRLRTGVTIAQARAELGAIATRLAERFPDTDAGWTLTLIRPRDQAVGAVRPALLLLLGGVGLVLLMACLNVANLLLARSVRRQREMAIRTAIGAARGRLWRQTLTESVLLTGMGAALAWFVLEALVRIFTALAPRDLPRLAEIAPDWRVAIYTAGVALATAIAAGWLPALAASRDDLQRRLSDAARGSTGARGVGLRSALVVAEVALAMVLAFGTGLLVRSFVSVLDVDPGFQADHLLTMQIGVPRADDTPDKRREFYRRLFARLEALPAVTAAAGTTRLPLTGFDSTTHLVVEGREDTAGFDVGLRRAMHGYFRVMRIPLVRGRVFDATDGPRTPAVVVVNETLASRVFPGEDPLGRRITLGKNAGIGTATIVGVVGDVRHTGLEAPPEAEVYIDYLQYPPVAPLIVMRTRIDPPVIAPAVRGAVRDVDPALTAYDVRPMSALRDQALTERRFVTAVALVFGLVALTLAVVGVYGVMVLFVSERTPEIGIRLALGAEPRTLVALVVSRGVQLAAAGVALGLGAALVAAPLMATQVFGVEPRDPVTLAGVPALLLLSAVAACVIPARRAMRVDPVSALR